MRIMPFALIACQYGTFLFFSYQFLIFLLSKDADFSSILHNVIEEEQPNEESTRPKKKGTFTSETAREAGRKGGLAHSAHATRDDYSEYGRKGGETTKRRHGTEHYSRIGKKGGKASRPPNRR